MTRVVLLEQRVGVLEAAIERQDKKENNNHALSYSTMVILAREQAMQEADTTI